MWLPVFLACGIGGYFSLAEEPTRLFVAVLWGGTLLGALLIRRFMGWVSLSTVMIAVVSGGVVAKIRTEIVRAPIVSKVKGFYSIEGKLERLSLLPGNQKRLHLSKLSMSKLPLEKTPEYIRITSRIKDQPLIVGSRVKLRAILRPPPGPVRPDGFDFARQAWFERLGAVGFAVSRVETVRSPQRETFWTSSERVRQLVSNKIRAVLGGHGGDIAVALVTGEKQSIDKKVLASIRAAGLAHMLAISGMHMALVAGTTFWVLRALLALSQTLALVFDVRKIASVGAILVAGGYYLLSGMGISTLRAFIMITIMFVAILLGRKALSLRNISVAALLILMFWPESLLSVGFQMSFASVVALVAFYEGTVFYSNSTRSDMLAVRLMAKVVQTFAGISATTLVAGLAVAPIAVYHFHHITTYSVVGNILAMPVLSVVVMPMALIGLVAMPFDLHAIPFAVMGWGSEVIIAIADYVAGFDDARVNVGTIGPAALLFMCIGGLWLCLWGSRLRYVGVFLILIGIGMAAFRATPFLLIERDGRNIVLIDENKIMWPVAPRVGRYSLEKWRSAYGALGSAFAQKLSNSQPKNKRNKRIAARRSKQWRCDPYGCTTLFQSMLIAYSSHPGALTEDCANADILVATYPVLASIKPCQRVKTIIDIKSLKRNGSHALYLENQQLIITHSRQVRGKRPWTHHN